MMAFVESLCRSNVISEDDRVVIQCLSRARALPCEILGIVPGRQNVHPPASDYGSPQFTALITVIQLNSKLEDVGKATGEVSLRT
jgi:hypothetical protein